MRTLSPSGPTRGPRRPADPQRPIASGLKPSGRHVELIDGSHQRCLALGVSRIERPDLSTLGQPDLRVARERNLRLYDHAAPVMEMLHEQIVDSHSMVVLTDATGTVLHSIGDDDFLGRATQVALAPGANWSEQAKGTNAVGTALIEEQPVLVHADEHFLYANHFLTCSAAPILDPRGNILGVLDVSGDHRSYHPHTMALVKMSARMIENRWLTHDDRNVMRLHFHGRAEFIGTLMEGILSVSADGQIVGANRGALEQLGLSGAALRLHSLTTLFGTTVDALVDRFRNPLATPLAAHAGNHRPLHLQARFNWPQWAHPAAGLPAAAPPTVARAAPTVNRAAQTAPQRRDDSGPSALDDLCTGDGPFGNVVTKLRRVLDGNIPILLLGETGTGKEVLARAFHADSARAGHAFVAVNCASADTAAIEAELFGLEDGALPGTRCRASAGKIVQADGGTLFLDEIGDMPMALQARLLRVLQDRQVTPLGGARPVAFDAAILCATHHNLRQRIAQGLFREDLFYRLNGLTLQLPPLRSRSDRMALVQRILAHACEGRDRPLDADVVQLFDRHPWPGNLRQLFNVLRTACRMAAAGTPITREHLDDDFLAAACEPAVASTDDGAPRTMADLEVSAIRQAVAQCGGNISEASKRLGISRNTIYRKLR